MSRMGEKAIGTNRKQFEAKNLASKATSVLDQYENDVTRLGGTHPL
jgi:hypothetical protein